LLRGRRLDYDSIADHTYNFTIMATDNGYPVSHSGSAMVRVSVTNVNDEDPVFMQAVEHILVSEDAVPNTVIHVVQAYDPDGDDVTFSFTGEKLWVCPYSPPRVIILRCTLWGINSREVKPQV